MPVVGNIDLRCNGPVAGHVLWGHVLWEEDKKKEICERRGAGQGVMKTFCFSFCLFVSFFDKKLREWQNFRNNFAPPPQLLALY